MNKTDKFYKPLQIMTEAIIRINNMFKLTRVISRNDKTISTNNKQR